ncbi:MAG: neutral/alkaline non-lysosomal ceramidase N-terminal domain-containing protein [Planctomycetes bacterium]|nr:neutral/alkaline non-lysosomal ceramidase N-terminal domain-containing protein [Planctomycetota bacterium]
MRVALRRRSFVLAAIGLFSLSTALWPQSAQAQNQPGATPVFRAGAFAADITPEELPISVNGNMRDATATNVHDRLHARAVVLDDGQNKLAIVVCDSCAISREIMDEAKQMAAQATGIPTSNMLISATHAHSCPTSVAVFQSEPDRKYTAFLARQIAKGIHQANAQLEPAEIAWGAGNDPTQLFNRRWKMKPGTIAPDPFGNTTDTVKMNPGRQNANLVEPAGTVDPEVSFVALRAKGGRPIALLANYSLHYVGGVPPLSADYFGAFAERIGELLGARDAKPAFVGMMSNGTSGDVNNVNFTAPAPPRQEPYEQCRIVANSVAQAVMKALPEVKYHAWAPLAAREREIELGVRLPRPEEIDRAKQLVAAAKEPVMKTLDEIYARETILLSQYPSTVRSKIQALKIGELGIVSSPCETFTETGLAVKRESPLGRTFTIELANGYNGYLPPPEQHKLGGYETWRARSSYLAVDAEPKIRATQLELLRELAKGK